MGNEELKMQGDNDVYLFKINFCPTIKMSMYFKLEFNSLTQLHGSLNYKS